MTTRREAHEWMSLAYHKGYRDSLCDLPPMRCKTLAKWLIGPVYGWQDAKALRVAYMFGRSIGDDQKKEEQDIT